jgi:hypothetical protein
MLRKCHGEAADWKQSIRQACAEQCCKACLRGSVAVLQNWQVDGFATGDTGCQNISQAMPANCRVDVAAIPIATIIANPHSHTPGN